MNAILTKLGALFATGLIAVTGAAPALAANIANAQVNASIKSALTADAPSVSDLAKVEGQEDADQAQIDALTKQTASASCGWDCIDKKLIALGDKMTTNRISALTTVMSYIENKQGISDTDRAALVAKVQTNIDEMTALKAKIDADTNHTTLVADVESITVNYRVYMLVIPQVSLLASADHKEWVYTYLTGVAADLQTKINAMSDATKKAQAQADLNDMLAKIADAKTNADAVISGITGLVPDQGNASVRKANKAALDLATTEVTTAHTDYVAARADVDAIHALLNGSATGGNGHVIMKVNPSGPTVSALGHTIMKVNPGTPSAVHANTIMKVTPAVSSSVNGSVK